MSVTYFEILFFRKSLFLKLFLKKDHFVTSQVFLINKLLTRTLILHYALHQPKQPRLPGSGNHHGQTPLP